VGLFFVVIMGGAAALFYWKRAKKSGEPLLGDADRAENQITQQVSPKVAHPTLLESSVPIDKNEHKFVKGGAQV